MVIFSVNLQNLQGNEQNESKLSYHYGFLELAM